VKKAGRRATASPDSNIGMAEAREPPARDRLRTRRSPTTRWESSPPELPGRHDLASAPGQHQFKTGRSSTG
jgi:hypothetical protein